MESGWRNQAGVVIHKALYAGKYGALAVKSFPPWAFTTFTELSTSQKVFVFSVSLGGSMVWFLRKYFIRKRRPLTIKSLRGANRRARQLSISSKTGESSSKRGNTTYDWIDLQRKAASQASNFDKESVTSAATLVIDGTPLSPQQLGLMGMEALETVVGYWEDALAAYHPSQNGKVVLTTAEEAAFVKMLENILEAAYNLQEESEHMFIHQESILNRGKRNKHLSVNFADGSTEVDGSCVSLCSKSQLLSVSSVDQDSFVSAQDTIADLRDFEDLIEIVGETDAKEALYLEALEHLEKDSIPFRSIRTEFVGCVNDTEYLAKLHCLRLAFKFIMSNTDDRNWWADNGRKILAEIMIQSEKDPKDFIQVYDDLLEFLQSEDNIEIMADELKQRNVQVTNFYDIVLDYILIDSFEDLESPPSSVGAVMNNRWLSNGFKETALQTAIWSVLKAKRRLLRYPDGFKAQFYNLSEIIIPTLAWGFFGPDEAANTLMCYFRDQVLDFIRGLYDVNSVRYTTIEELSKDIMTMARLKFQQTLEHMQSLADNSDQ